MPSFRYPVEEIRERCDLVEIVSQHVALRKRGRTMEGLCPFHNEKTPSFHVNPERQIWKCFGCGEGGDVFKFLQKIDNLTFPEAVEQLANKYGIKIDRSERATQAASDKERLLRANNIACAFFRTLLSKSSKAQEYIARRGLTEATIEKYKLGYAPDEWDSLLNHLTMQRVSPADALKAGLIIARENSQGFYDRFRDRLIFPIMDTSERIIAFGGRVMGEGEPKYLNSPETPLFIKNKTLYGLNFARRAIPAQDKLLVVEGYMDVITTQEAGFENTVATMGTALTEEHVNVIARFTQNVILSFDADSAGIAAALRSSPIFERAGFNVRILSMPRGEDPDSILRGGDTARFATMLERALPVPDYRVKLVLHKHDINTDQGKAAALKEIVGVLAEVESVVDRERLIRHLVKFHPNFNTGTTLAEDHLRAEVARFRSRASRQKVSYTRQPGKEVMAEVANTETKLSLAEKSERLLLGIIILQEFDASKVFEALPAKEFTEGGTRVLAEAVSRQCTLKGKIDREALREEASGTLADALLTDILVGLDDSDMNYPTQELIQVIINHKKNERRQRIRALADKFQSGEIKHGDPEFEEWTRLMQDKSPWRR
ncbi:MAG: DNA primase [Armatimonadetes bacterium]|nr:DNA primase [Armatimonadota bacterium]